MHFSKARRIAIYRIQNKRKVPLTRREHLSYVIEGLSIITTPNRELCVFQEFRKIGFCDYQNVFSRNEEKVNFKVPPVGRKNSDNNISSAKMKFSRNEENVLWILYINNNI